MSRFRSLLIATICAASTAAAAEAAPGPVDPIRVLAAEDIRNVQPWSSPSGEQLVTWNQLTPSNSIRLIERKDGSAFSEPVDLTTIGNAEPPDLSFTSDGGIFAIWGVSTSGGKAQQAIRPAGGEFTPAVPVNDCRRFVDSAAGPDGGIAVSCSWGVTANSPSVVRLSSVPTLGPVSNSAGDDLIQPVFDSFISPQVVWGKDGTIATAFDQSLSTINPPPANQVTRVRVALRGPSVADTADLGQVTGPDRVTLGGIAITPTGTVGVSYSNNAGPVLRVRQPGLLQPYGTFSLPGEESMAPVADDQGNIHVVSVQSDPQRSYWVNVWTPGNPAMSVPVQIPLGGSPDPYIPYEQGFRVAPDGTEFALMTADDGVYATSRRPGAATFETPTKIGPPSIENPHAEATKAGDFLVAWTNGEVGEQQLLFGGLDSGKPPTIAISEFPSRVTDGATGRFSASATDSMGLRKTEWRFGDGSTVQGDVAEHRFTQPGNYQVRFVATDRAGNQAVENRTVVVPVGPNSKPLLKLKTAKKIRFRVLKRRGVRVVVTGRPKVKIRAVIGTSQKNARLRPMRVKVVKKLRNRHVFRIKPRPARLGKTRKFRLFVQVAATTAVGNRTTKSRVVQIRR